MNKGNDSWLTLAEVIRKSNLDDIEARRMLKELRGLLTPRHFGDIVKYPAPVADLLARFTSLRRQGYSVEKTGEAFSQVNDGTNKVKELMAPGEAGRNAPDPQVARERQGAPTPS